MSIAASAASSSCVINICKSNYKVCTLFFFFPNQSSLAEAEGTIIVFSTSSPSIIPSNWSVEKRSSMNGQRPPETAKRYRCSWMPERVCWDSVRFMLLVSHFLVERCSKNTSVKCEPSQNTAIMNRAASHFRHLLPLS